MERTKSDLFTQNFIPASDLYLRGAIIAPRKIKTTPQLVFDGQYTIYHNEFGEKTIVKQMDGESYDPEKAACYAVLKSLGIKPKFINNLVDNAVDKKASREKRNAKKEKAKQAKQKE